MEYSFLPKLGQKGPKIGYFPLNYVKWKAFLKIKAKYLKYIWQKLFGFLLFGFLKLKSLSKIYFKYLIFFIFKLFDGEFINRNFFLVLGKPHHCVHWGITFKNTIPSFLPSPPLKSANCPSPSFFRQSSLYIGFCWTPLKLSCKNCNPPQKCHSPLPHFPTNAPLKLKVLSSPPFWNLLGSSTPTPWGVAHYAHVWQNSCSGADAWNILGWSDCRIL